MARRIVRVAAVILHLNDFDSCSVLTGSLIVKGLTLSRAVLINEVSKILII